MPNASIAGLVLVFALLAVGCTPSDPVAEARELLAANSPQLAVEALRKVGESRSEDPEVHYLYGIAMARLGQPNLGRWSLRKAMEDPEWLVPAGLELVRSSLLTRGHDAAVATADRILEAEPDHMEGLLLRSRARVESRRNYEGALADADRALELDPDEPEALILRVVSLIGLERIEEAEPTVDDLARRFAELDLGLEQEVRYCTTRAAFAAAKGELETAAERFDQCIALAPTHALIVGEALKFHDSQGRPERSLEILRGALEAKPDAPAYRRDLGARLVRAGQPEEAHELLLEGTLLADASAAVSAWLDLGNYYVAADDHAAAASAVDSAVARTRELGVEPEPQLLFHQADTLVIAGRHNEALELARSMQLPSHRALVEGRVYLEQGRNAEALEKFEQGLLLWPDNAVARYYAAISAERIGDIDRAIEEYRYSIRAGAGETDARLRLARLHAAEGDMVRADRVWATGSAPMDDEHQLAGIRFAARSGQPEVVRRRTARYRGTPSWGRAAAAVAEGVGERRGPAMAARVVRESPDLDLTQPMNAEALRVLVASLAEMGKVGEASPIVDAAIARGPNVPLLHTLRGRVLEGSGAPTEEARGAYSRALELDGRQVLALEGLARLALRAGSPQRAVDLYARAAAADDAAAAPVRAASELLISLGKAEKAEEQLAELIERDPYDPWGSLRLAELRVARGADSDRTLVLVRQALRFQGGPEAEALLARVEGPPTGEPGQAAVAAERGEGDAP